MGIPSKVSFLEKVRRDKESLRPAYNLCFLRVCACLREKQRKREQQKRSIYIFIHTYIYIYKYIQIFVYKYIYMYVDIYTYVDIYMCIYMYIQPSEPPLCMPA